MDESGKVLDSSDSLMGGDCLVSHIRSLSRTISAFVSRTVNTVAVISLLLQYTNNIDFMYWGIGGAWP